MKFFLYHLALLFAIQPLLAATNSFLPKVFSFKFEQRYTSAIKGKEKTGTGSIVFQTPKSIRLEITSPTPIIFVSNEQDKSWFYRPPFIQGEEGEVSIGNGKDQHHAFLNFFNLLHSGLVSNQSYNITTDIAKNEVGIHFSSPVIKEYKIKSASLTFVDKNFSFNSLSKIQLTYDDDKKVFIKLLELSLSPSIKPDTFQFKIPPKTKIIN